MYFTNQIRSALRRAAKGIVRRLAQAVSRRFGGDSVPAWDSGIQPASPPVMPDPPVVTVPITAPIAPLPIEPPESPAVSTEDRELAAGIDRLARRWAGEDETTPVLGRRDDEAIELLQMEYGDVFPAIVWKDLAHASSFRGWLFARLRWARQNWRGAGDAARVRWQERMREIDKNIDISEAVLVDGYGLTRDEARRPYGTDASFAAVKRALDSDPRFNRFYHDPNRVIRIDAPAPDDGLLPCAGPSCGNRFRQLYLNDEAHTVVRSREEYEQAVQSNRMPLCGACKKHARKKSARGRK